MAVLSFFKDFECFGSLGGSKAARGRRTPKLGCGHFGAPCLGGTALDRLSPGPTCRATASAALARKAARGRRTPKLGWLCLAAGLCACFEGNAQDNYEIQVYGSETVPAGRTMVEIHSNFAVQGETEEVNGVLPSRHALHETLEVTHGFTPWFETGFYVFSSIQPGHAWEWVGDHIRPRVAVPTDWHWPVGLSLSTEIGYQRPSFSEDTWNWEIRPIIDKQWGRWYFAVNPALEKSLKGLNSNQGWGFAPSAKVSYDVTKVIAFGAEYYSSLGPIGGLSNWSNQQHQVFPTVDLNLSPDWEFNFGVGFGLTGSTDRLIIKLILGYRF